MGNEADKTLHKLEKVLEMISEHRERCNKKCHPYTVISMENVRTTEKALNEAMSVIYSLKNELLNNEKL